MKKRFKGRTLKEAKEELDKYYDSLSDEIKNMSGEFVCDTDKKRTDGQNKLFHAMVGVLAAVDNTDPKHFKLFIKNQLGLYTFTELYSDDSVHLTRVFLKTSNMNTKELAEVILKLEIWALEHMDFTFTKKDLEEHMKNEELKTW